MFLNGSDCSVQRRLARSALSPSLLERVGSLAALLSSSKGQATLWRVEMLSRRDNYLAKDKLPAQCAVGQGAFLAALAGPRASAASLDVVPTKLEGVFGNCFMNAELASLGLVFRDKDGAILPRPGSGLALQLALSSSESGA
jgi:hypothetical protein